MEKNRPIDILSFFVAGINYKKADATIRGAFAIHNQGYQTILNDASLYNIDSFFILSTCNRTEIYGFASNPDQLIDLLCTQTEGSTSIFKSLAYIKNGTAAIEHLFHVGTGLDSQILGDYEIIGQLKQSVKFARERGFINGFLERLVNSVLQTSKMIKNETDLSGGTVSVSFAAVQYIKRNIKAISGKKILVIGIGKIGRNTCKNLVDYLGTTNITLMNRSEEKANQLASELNLQVASVTNMAHYISLSDVILVATSSSEPVILKSQLENKGEKLIIDLSVPNNVEASIADLLNITMVNVDELSKSKDETLEKRKSELPKARLIIQVQLATFMEWVQHRKNASALMAIKHKLYEIHIQHQNLLTEKQCVFQLKTKEQHINRVIKDVANKMRVENKSGCYYIEAINEFMVHTGM